MRLAAVKNEKAAAQEFHDATANPNHSKISPKKLAQETSSKQPPKKETGKNEFIKMELKARQQAKYICTELFQNIFYTSNGNYNHHHILRLFDVLPNFSLATSQTGHGY